MITGNKLLKYGIVAAVVIVVLSYAFYQTRNIIKGGVITIDYPTSGMTLKESLVEIRGTIKNASYITMNGRQIFVDEEGNFKEKLLLSEGYNITEIEIQDRFERIKKEVLELIYEPSL
ncbi:hypothetical protein A2442_02585 [Candidatus Campbellbacteria bacterium RIFOXYC2_FULL_35_25]|uniref:Uncharacterized protein n=1 Tax=Candidatus Campbellbacteria bacterium RIFOXYC2_FULL_35_25 TaxID=1797582 RepID=A0A1F5EHU5_9BACT|nr:MAG: hypothetical protein A2442_02585 [Candidatus Campbellbacteria bacterium RIFOXYC2_FULL_35_25]